MAFEINTSVYEKLDRSFYEKQDVVEAAKNLVGKFLITSIDGIITIGKIVETEAYSGRSDKACHAYKRRTPRTEVMYGPGGHAYVYICYGIHRMFNVVTNIEGMADAVLIRAIEPVDGLDEMKRRRGNHTGNLTSGPGVLTLAMGIKSEMTGIDLLGDKIYIASQGNEACEIEISTRIGIDYAEEDAFKPWRFYMKGNKYVSGSKKKAQVDKT